MIAITQRQASRIVVSLTRVADRLESESCGDWFTFARAAAMIEAIRMGRATGENMGLQIKEIVTGLDVVANECNRLTPYDVISAIRAALLLRGIVLGAANIQLYAEVCHV